MPRKKRANKDLIEQYASMEDFGFSADISAEKAKSDVNKAQSDVKNYQERLEKAERLIMPLLSNLVKTADESDTIYWPNRKELLEEKIEELLEITRTN